MSQKMVRSDAVEYLQDQGVPATYPTLSNWARQNKGPTFTKVDGRPVYDEETLKKFAEEYKQKRTIRGW
jgi:hypothetical protein